MKYFTVLLALAMVFAWFGAAFGQATEGNDLYGYYWQSTASSKDTLGSVTYEWIDITATGKKAPELGDDNFFHLDQSDMPFPFKYYWNTYQDLYIGTNGYIMFGRGMNVASGQDGFPTFPTQGPITTANNYLGGMLCDLTFSDGEGNPVPDAALWYGVTTVNGKQALVISFVDVPFWTSEADTPDQYRGKNTFQFVLFDDYSIKINYKAQEGEVATAYQPSPQRPNVKFLTSGMENNTGKDGSGWTDNTYPKAGSSIEVWYPESSTYEFIDAEASWVFNADNYGSIIWATGDPIELKMAVRNTGTVDLDTISVQVDDYSYNNIAEHQTIQREMIGVGKLKAGESKVLTVDKKPSFTQNDVIRVAMRVKTPGVSDGFFNNNSIEGQIVVVEKQNEMTAVGYDRFLANPNREQDWNFTNDGFAGLIPGMYIQPPTYPSEVMGIEVGLVLWTNDVWDNGVWVSGRPDSLVGYKIRVYSEADNGLVGDLIEEIEADTNEYAGTYNEQDSPQMLPVKSMLKNKITLENGKGLFVTVQPNELPAGQAFQIEFVGVDKESNQVKPKSYRSFEITGGHWAPHRERSDTDFPIRLLVNTGTGRAQDAAAKFVQVGQNYPNPTGDRLQLPYTVLRPTDVTFTLQNAVGQVVETRSLGRVAPGEYVLTQDVGNLPTGVYSYTLNVGGGSASRKMMIAR